MTVDAQGLLEDRAGLEQVQDAELAVGLLVSVVFSRQASLGFAHSQTSKRPTTIQATEVWDKVGTYSIRSSYSKNHLYKERAKHSRLRNEPRSSNAILTLWGKPPFTGAERSSLCGHGPEDPSSTL